MKNEQKSQERAWGRLSWRVQLWSLLLWIRKRIHYFITLLIGMIAGLLMFAFVMAGQIYDYQDTVDGVHLPPVDAIVCLAGGKGRIAAAGDIWYRYWELSRYPLRGVDKAPVPDQPPFLYFSGVGPRSNWKTIARSVRRGVLEALRPEYILLENESSNTEENAAWLLKHARLHHWERVLLITSTYHMKRAKLIFERVIGESEHPLKVETLSVYTEPFDPDDWRLSVHGIRVTLAEYFKWIYYTRRWKPAVVIR